MTSAADRRLFARIAMPRPARAESPDTAVLPQIAPWALASSMLIPVVLTSSWLVAGALQPPSYSPVRQTVSVLAGYAGTDRWIVTAALYAAGCAYLVTAAGFRALEAPARAGLVIAGVAALGVASFPEPAHGTSGDHAIFTGIGALALGLWPALAARQESVRAAIGHRLSLAASAVSVALLLWTFVETRNGGHLGLAERVSSALQVTWPLVVAIAVLRARERSHHDQSRNTAIATY